MRAFMDIERCSNTMAGPMAVIQALTPQRGASKAVQGKSWRPLWEDCLVQCNVSLHAMSSNVIADVLSYAGECGVA